MKRLLAAGALVRTGPAWRGEIATTETDSLDLDAERGIVWRAMQNRLAEEALPGSTTAFPPAGEQHIEDGWCPKCDNPNCYRSTLAALRWRNQLLWMTR